MLVLSQELKEEEMTEEEKAAQKAKPVATNPIPGTPWYMHSLKYLLTRGVPLQVVGVLSRPLCVYRLGFSRSNHNSF